MSGQNTRRVADIPPRHVMSGREVVERFQAHGLQVRGTGPWKAQCPVHDDHTPSVSIRELPSGKVSTHCFVCCDNDRVLAAVGLKWQDVTPARAGGATTRTHQRPVVKPVPPKPKAELDRVLDAFHNAGMAWRAMPRPGVYRCECPSCLDEHLSAWVIDVSDDDRTEPVRVACANGCSPRVMAYLLRAWAGWTA
jgi:hypothetical protein